MLRHILLATLLVFSNVAVAGNKAKGKAKHSDEQIMPASDDDRWTHLPWSAALPFPWEDIQGLWRVESGDYVSYFAFKVVKQKANGSRQLQVKQIDGETRQVLATGVGFESGQVVFAQMTSCGGSTYRVKLTSFKFEDAPQPPLMGKSLYTGSVMVLSIGELDNRSDDDMVHMQIMKVSSRYRFTQEFCSISEKN